LNASADNYYNVFMTTKPYSVDVFKEAGIGAFFRPRDVAPLGISFYTLKKLVITGRLEKVARGLYRQKEIEPNELETVAMVASSVPSGIICLLTALRIHGIGTQAPHEVWLALDRKARKPSRLPTKIRIVRFSGAMLRYGVTVRSILGVPVRLTSPARTVVDCFRYRNKLGLDIALEALKDSIRMRAATVDEISRAAEVCRVSTVLRAYLETIGS
jgi:predicted transcriptional regulator of viral defense system